MDKREGSSDSDGVGLGDLIEGTWDSCDVGTESSRVKGSLC